MSPFTWPDADARIIVVAEQWLPQIHEREAGADGGPDRQESETGSKGFDEAKTFASHARGILERLFPDWSLTAQAVSGSPALRILTEAEEFKPDLIVVGSHGRTAVGRLLLGSISQKVLAEAKCSVRIGRQHKESNGKRVVVIGFDGSPGSNGAVDAVARRSWEGECEIHLVTASDAIVPTTIGRFIPPVVKWIEEEVKTEREAIRRLAESAFIKLEGAGCEVSLSVRNGNPRQVIVEEAERLRADCIFLGAHSYVSKLERFLIGSTSSAVAARADCSVEVIRPAG